MTSTPLTEQQLDQYAELAITAEHDGIKVNPSVVTVLVDEVRRIQYQRRFLLGQIAKKDAESGAGDRALAEFLAADPDEETHVVADDSDDPEHVDDCPGCRPAAVPSV